MDFFIYWGRLDSLNGGPYPLGKIFMYSLGRESTPLCSYVLDVSNENGTRVCLTNSENEQKFNWDLRDFIVPVNAIEDFLSAICSMRTTQHVMR
jgi:hypothetical protein